MSTHKLQEKVWYRALKVIFILFFVFVVICVESITYSMTNGQTVPMVICDSNKAFLADGISLETQSEKSIMFARCGGSTVAYAPSAYTQNPVYISTQMLSALYYGAYITTFPPSDPSDIFGPLPTAYIQALISKGYIVQGYNDNAGVHTRELIEDGSNFVVADYVVADGVSGRVALPERLLILAGVFLLTTAVFWLIARTFLYIFVGKFTLL